MRHLTKLIGILTAIIVLVLSTTACKITSGNATATIISTSENMVVIRIENTDGKATLVDVLKNLRTNKEIDFKIQDGTYGAYITSVNGKSEVVKATEGYSWMIYTTDTEIANTEDKIDGTDYYSAMLGISTITVKKGHSYVLYYGYWSF